MAESRSGAKLMEGHPGVKQTKACSGFANRSWVKSGTTLITPAAIAKALGWEGEDWHAVASAIAFKRAKDPCLGQFHEAGIVIAERLAQDFPGMLAQQGRGDGVSDRRQAKLDRRFNVGN